MDRASEEMRERPHLPRQRRGLPRLVRLLSLMSPLAAGLMGVACSENSPVGVPLSAPQQQELLNAVTGPAAAALGPDGKFQLSAPSVRTIAEVSAVEATRIAAAYAPQYGPLFGRFLEKTHGASINFRSLRVCGRPLYARNALLPLGEEIPLQERRPYGPYWLVTLCNASDVPTVSLAISAWATDLSIKNGKIELPPIHGGEFFALGIPLGHVGEFPSSPEAAVTFAAQQSGHRAASVPELIMPLIDDGPPQAARWHITLDAAARFQGIHSGIISGKDVFVGPPRVTQVGVTQYVPAPVQPDSQEVHWFPLPEVLEPWDKYNERSKVVKVAFAKRRQDVPGRFEAVIATGGQ